MVKENSIDTHKRREGSIEFYGNNKARLKYMYKGIYYRESVSIKDKEDGYRQLVLFVDKVKNGKIASSNMTFSDLAQIWLDEHIRPNCSERHIKKSIGFLNNRILPYIGNKKIKDINKRCLESYFNFIKTTKTKYKNRPNTQVKPATVTKLKNIINSILNYGVECEYIPYNPGNRIKINFHNTKDEEIIKQLVKEKIEKISYYTPEEFKSICSLLEEEFKNIYNDNNILKNKKVCELGRRLIILLALKTGMRRSEIFGLARNKEYNDLDVENKTFTVTKTRHYLSGIGKYTSYPKSDFSIRCKSLPNTLVEIIKMYYNYLDKINYKETYIFENISIDGICSWWCRWRDKNNFPQRRFHDLRHTHATILLANGVDFKTISERLGHSSIDITLNIYADVLKELDKKSSDVIDNI